MAGINLDAILGEAEDKPLTLKGRVFLLPGELPGLAVAPFLAEDLGIIEIVADAISSDDENDEIDVIDTVFDLLKSRPTLPRGLLEAAKAALDELLGEQADDFYALKPSVPAYFALAKNLVREYGFGLTDFFGSAEQSPDAGPTSSTTSNTTSDSTPEVSSEPQEILAS